MYTMFDDEIWDFDRSLRNFNGNYDLRGLIPLIHFPIYTIADPSMRLGGITLAYGSTLQDSPKHFVSQATLDFFASSFKNRRQILTMIIVIRRPHEKTMPPGYHFVNEVITQLNSLRFFPAGFVPPVDFDDGPQMREFLDGDLPRDTHRASELEFTLCSFEDETPFSMGFAPIDDGTIAFVSAGMPRTRLFEVLDTLIPLQEAGEGLVERWQNDLETLRDEMIEHIRTLGSRG